MVCSLDKKFADCFRGARNSNVTTARVFVACTVALLLVGSPRRAAAEYRSTVPPTLEIEVIDPNADPLSRPAVDIVRDENGQMVVDIPPAVLVHRYYYTGDRAFQAQFLPGGPTIVVVNHPKTGERCYIDVQMLPGAPRVIYTDHEIEYDYGERGISVVFGLFGKPSVKYRNGMTATRRIGKLVHMDELKKHASKAHEQLKQGAEFSKTIVYGAVATVSDSADQVISPVKGVLESLPLGKILFDPTLEQQLMTTAAEHKRKKQMEKLEKQKQRNELTRRTIR